MFPQRLLHCSRSYIACNIQCATSWRPLSWSIKNRKTTQRCFSSLTVSPRRETSNLQHTCHPALAHRHRTISIYNVKARAMEVKESRADGATPPKRQVFFFDVDNCLYPKSAKVHDRMAELIDRYFATHLSLPWDDAVRLHKEYYQNYGLAIEGLVRHHQIDPLDYNTKVDDALELDGIIKPRPELKQLLADIDTSKVKLWLLTNAYISHAKRVIRLLDVEEYFEGVTYCDYSSVPLTCKPHPDMYHKAMKEAGVDRYEDCFFVDDSYGNCKSAQELGWTTAHLVEDGVTPPKTPASKYQIQHLEELRSTFPRFFAPGSN